MGIKLFQNVHYSGHSTLNLDLETQFLSPFELIRRFGNCFTCEEVPNVPIVICVLAVSLMHFRLRLYFCLHIRYFTKPIISRIVDSSRTRVIICKYFMSLNRLGRSEFMFAVSTLVLADRVSCFRNILVIMSERIYNEVGDIKRVGDKD